MKLNHILVLTIDLPAMEYFWTKVIGLRVGERPPFPFKGLWLYSDDKPLVHVAELNRGSFGVGLNESGATDGVIAHVALEGADYKTLLERLNKYALPYTEKEVPLSGNRQVFITGPDGVTVEMLFELNQQLQPVQKQYEQQLYEQQRNESMHNNLYNSNDKLEFLGGKVS